MALFDRLEGAGFKVFIDQRRLLPGERLAGSLQKALARSKSAVVVISRNWLESPWCQEEGDVLLHRKIENPSFHLVPVRIDDCAMPPMWSNRLWLDFANTPAPEGAALRRLQFALIGQVPPADDAAEVRVFKAETEATDEVFAELRAAARVGPMRVFEVWRKWREAGMPDAPANLYAAQTLLQLARPDRALEVLTHAKTGDRADELRALALARLDRLNEAIEILTRLYDRQRTEVSSETGGILGGRYKQRWLRTGNRADMLASYEIYNETYERTKAAYTGVNAAAMALAKGDRAESARIARKVLASLEGVEPEKLDHWERASLAESYLLVNDFDNAKKWYAKAVAYAPERHQDIAVMRRQARRNLESLGMPRDALDEVLDVPRAAAFSGHMVDAPGRAVPRFPKEKVGAVRKAIAEKLKNYGIGYGFSSAARGSDLLFVDELRKRGGTPMVFLPFPREDFKRTSVGQGWDETFDKLLDGLEVVQLAERLPAEAEQPDAYMTCNERILEEAVRKAKLLDHEPLLITVWNGNPGDGAGGTADAIRAWQDQGHDLDVIDISKL
jgi:tetratricopeptide (TPR) repeat protein